MAKKTKKKGKEKKKNLPQLKQAVLEFFEKNLHKTYSLKQLTRKMDIREKDLKSLIPQLVFDLEEEGLLQKLRNNTFRRKRSDAYYEGIVDYVSSKYAYIIVEGLEQDIWVKSTDLNNALDGDRVKVRLLNIPKGDRRPEGEVMEIVERKRSEFVGRIEISPRYAFVIADYRKMHHDIFIPFEDIGEAKHNDKVLIRITEWPTRDKNPVGEIIQVLGPAGDNEAEIHSIMAEFGLPFDFSPSLEAQAKRIKDAMPPEEIARRRDLRDVLTITIDPEDAKDFDDAISFKRLDNGRYEIGVHIADVTYYVRNDTELDKEALKRGTSVYLVDRTIPMLPERLSNELCSLRPNEDKFTFSAIFELDDKGIVKNEWFGKTLINSNRRFSYEEAQERIETLQGDYAKEITILNELALKLKVDRFMRGAINFETVEVKFRLDSNGKPLEVIPKERKDAHKLIEEFMLLANKRVAEFVFNMKQSKKNRNTFVYRTHDFPDPDKIKAFSVFAQKFGHKLKTKEEAIAKSLNNLIEDIEGKPEQNVLEQLAIRAMAKAKYTTEESGHFGLGFPHYTHFTSPIRRYPDMMVHRLLFHYLQQGKPADKTEYEQKCLHASEMEKRAADAERASIKYKQVEYMSQFIGEEYEGLVSGVTEWGVYVELIQTRCEGMIRVSQMLDDYYVYDDQNFRIIGKKNKKIISLGDQVKVKVIDTDIDRRTIDLEFV